MVMARVVIVVYASSDTCMNVFRLGLTPWIELNRIVTLVEVYPLAWPLEVAAAVFFARVRCVMFCSGNMFGLICDVDVRACVC